MARLSSRLALGIGIAGLISTGALAQTVVKQVNVPGGRIKVSLSPLPAAASPSGPKVMPKIGVSTNTDFARALDSTGRAQVVSPAKFGLTQVSFDAVTNAEFLEELGQACRQSRVDYALYTGQPQRSNDMSLTAMTLGFGRMGATDTFEMRLYECRTKQVVWAQKVAVQASSGIWTNGVMGKTSGGGSQSQEAASQIIIGKLVDDLGLGTGPAIPTVARAGNPTPALPVAAKPPPQDAADKALLVSKPGHLYRTPALSNKPLRTVAVGMILYPTGNTQGVWVEVTDEAGQRAWISTHVVEAYHQ